jgi:beta-lactamase superfamily II metal-dependent hydrolase
MRGKIRIRMYNVGFGDCFLVSVPARPRTLQILFDCGSHAAGPGPRKIEEVVEDVIADVSTKGKARIDVVIATHRHQDHVSGFQSELWSKVEVGEVWMPWTEDPEDSKARKILETQSRLALHLESTMLTLGLADEVIGVARNSLTNAKAMRTLHDGFAGQPRRRFLPPTPRAKCSFTSARLPGVKIHILGPSRDPEVIRDMDPPAAESYLRLQLAKGAGPTEATLPFRSNWLVPETIFATERGYLALKSSEIGRIINLGKGEEFELAVALDKAVNGTSLMIMLQIGSSYLLFPGDAQWGTWSAALNDPVWLALLSRTTFLKVGHHGSHNASPKEFVEQVLGSEFLADVSTRPMSRWKYIPKRELLVALKGRGGKVARSDKAEEDPVEFKRVENRYVDVSVPM